MSSDNDLFDEFLALLEPDFIDTGQRYKHLRLKLAKFFSWRHCDDPYMLSDETITRLVKSINRGQSIRAEKPYSYVYGIAMNVFREYVRESRKYTQMPEEIIEAEPLLLPANDCRMECLQALPDDKIQLLNRYYLMETDLEKFARSRGLTIAALRLQIHRIKKELRACYDDCMKRKS
jgi:DNA-directed RNA polymerase specialized sigma24 family protein